MKKIIYCIYFIFLLLGCSAKSKSEKIKNYILENNTTELEKICSKHQKLIQEQGDIFLSYAAYPLNEDAVYVLIKHGANCQYMIKGKNLIQWSISENRNKVAFLAIEKSLNSNLVTPNHILEMSVQYDNSDVLQWMIEKDFDLKFKNTQNEALFDIALKNKNYRIAKNLLLKKDYIDYLKSESPQIMKVLIDSWDNEFSPDLVNTIYPEGADFHDDTYLLVEAINACNFSAVCWLIDNGCDAAKEVYSSYFDNYVKPIEYAYEMEHRLAIISNGLNTNDEKLSELKKIIQILKTNEK